MENINDTVIYADGSAESLVKIIVEDKILNHDTLKWPKEKYNYPTQYLTLNEIQKQLEALYGDTVIIVFDESPLYGTIYRYGNYDPCEWEKYGTTKGFA